MTVRELIEALHKFPDDLPVYQMCMEEGEEEVKGVHREKFIIGVADNKFIYADAIVLET